jgi:hypothetical protein
MLIIFFPTWLSVILIGFLLHINFNTLVWGPQRTIGQVCAMNIRTIIITNATGRNILPRVCIYNRVYHGPLFLSSHDHSFGMQFLLLTFGRRNQ